MKRCIFLTFLFLASLLFNNNIYASDVKVTKLDGLVNWNDANNYIEAKKTLEIAKEINKEKRRRKELRDAGMSDEEIQKIIKNERIAARNGKISLDNKGTANDKENQIKNKKINESEENKVIINDYDSYGKSNLEINKSNQSTLNEDVPTIDLSAVPNPPIIFNKNQDVVVYNGNNYNEFEFNRMLQKAGENINDPQNFSVFAKEVARIANKPATNELTVSMPKMSKTDNTYIVESQKTNQFGRKNENLKNYQRGPGNVDTYKPSTRNIYAIAKKINKEKNLKTKKEKKHDYYAVNVIDDDNGLNNLDTISSKQIKARNIGAPFPLRRDDKNHLRQYQPQNISQVAYDKNNKHLKPIVFEKHIIDQVIDNLSLDNAVQITRALINKLGKTDVTDDDGNTILMHAVARKNRSLISMLLSEGANPNFLNKEGFAPIHLAASNGDDFSVYSLLISGGNPNLVDKNGNTPLMYASKMCNSNSVKMMIALGGDPLIENKFNRKTAIDFAKENKNSSVILSILTKTNQKKYGKRKPIILNNL